MVKAYGKKYKSAATNNVYAVTPSGNVIYRNDDFKLECGKWISGHGWIASGLTPSELEEMKLAGIVYPYSEG